MSDMTSIDVKCEDCNRDMRQICSEREVDYYNRINYCCISCTAKRILTPYDMMNKVCISRATERVVFGR